MPASQSHQELYTDIGIDDVTGSRSKHTPTDTSFSNSRDQVTNMLDENAMEGDRKPLLQNGYHSRTSLPTREQVFDALKGFKTTVNRTVSKQFLHLRDASKLGIENLKKFQSSYTDANQIVLNSKYPNEEKNSPEESVSSNCLDSPITIERSSYQYEEINADQPPMKDDSERMTSADNYEDVNKDGDIRCWDRYSYVIGVVFCLSFTVCDTAAKTFSQVTMKTTLQFQMQPTI